MSLLFAYDINRFSHDVAQIFIRVYKLSRLFHSLEPSQSLGGAKTGDPQEKPPDHPKAELGLSHT